MWSSAQGPGHGCRQPYPRYLIEPIGAVHQNSLPAYLFVPLKDVDVIQVHLVCFSLNGDGLRFVVRIGGVPAPLLIGLLGRVPARLLHRVAPFCQVFVGREFQVLSGVPLPIHPAIHRR